MYLFVFNIGEDEVSTRKQNSGPAEQNDETQVTEEIKSITDKKED